MTQEYVRTQEQPQRRPGDVLDGSVDYYDFNWGEPVIPQEGSIPCGCGPAQAYTCCKSADPTPDQPTVRPCVPSVPEQTDDPGYETVAP